MSTFRDVVTWAYERPLFSRVVPTLRGELTRELFGITSAIEIGCGEGTIVPSLIDGPCLGLEKFAPAAERARTTGRYSEIIEADALDLDVPDASVDAVVLLDVIEHLEKDAGYALLARAMRWARSKVILSTPNGFFPQAALNGNPWQVHKSGWSIEDLASLNMRIRGLAGHKWLHCEHHTSLPQYMTPFAATLKRPWSVTLPLAALTQAYTVRFPSSAFELFAVWERQVGIRIAET